MLPDLLSGDSSAAASATHATHAVSRAAASAASAGTRALAAARPGDALTAEMLAEVQKLLATRR